MFACERQALWPSGTGLHAMLRLAMPAQLSMGCARVTFHSPSVTWPRRFYQINDWLLARLDHAWAKFALVFGAHLVPLALLQASGILAVPKWGLLASEHIEYRIERSPFQGD